MKFLEITFLVAIGFSQIFATPIDGDENKDVDSISENLIESVEESDRHKKSNIEPAPVELYYPPPMQCNSCCDKPQPSVNEEKIYEAPIQYYQPPVYPAQCGHNLIVSCAPQVSMVPCYHNQGTYQQHGY